MARARADRYRVVYTISVATGVYTTTEKDSRTNEIDGFEFALNVDFPINFVGRGKSKTDVVFRFGICIYGHVHYKDGEPVLQPDQTNIHVHMLHLTVRNTMDNEIYGSGIYGSGKGSCPGKSNFFTLEDVLIEHCTNGLQAGDGIDCTCTNVEIRNCRNSGAVASQSGVITFKGPQTKVHCNECTWHTSYGLKVTDSDSFILLVEPLTRETVAFGNGNDCKNVGVQPNPWLETDINKQIKTIAATAETSTKRKKIYVCTACQKRFEHKLKLW